MARATADYVIRARDATEQAFRNIRRSVRQATEQFEGLGRAAKLTGAAIGASLAVQTKNTIETAAETGRLSKQYGLSTELLSEMRGVIRAAGGDFDQFVDAAKTAQERIFELGQESGEAVEAFDVLGLKFDDLANLTPDQQLEKIQRALGKVTDNTVRTAVANILYSDSANTMIRLLDLGAERVAEMREEQRKLGNSMSREMTDNAERASQALARLGDTLNGLIQSGILEWADRLADALDGVARHLQNVQDYRKSAGIFLPGGFERFQDYLEEQARPTVQLGPALQPQGEGRLEGSFTLEASKQTRLLEQLVQQGNVGRAG